MKPLERAEYARWAVKERYFGIFDQTRTICTCISLYDAANIIDNMVENHKGRTIEYFTEKIDENYDEIYDEEVIQDWDKERDLKPYKKGISCLIND